MTTAVQLPIGLYPDDKTISQRYEAFDAENPHVYPLLLEMARALKAAGKKRIGVKGLVELLRADLGVTTTGEPFKLDNRLTSRYAHRLAQEPDLAGLIELRGLRAA